MSVVDTNSLAATLDTVNEALFFGRALSQSDKKKAVVWIAGRQGLRGSYAGMFAPTESDIRGVKLFTGESTNSMASTAHILGEEACRALILLDGGNTVAAAALKRATNSMLERLLLAEARWNTYGFF